MTGNLLSLAEKIRTALETAGPIAVPDLGGRLPGTDREEIDRALKFLADRDEVLVDALDQSINLRQHVNRSILEALADGSLTIDALSRRTPFSPHVCGDVIGWLEREGRISLTGDVVSLRR